MEASLALSWTLQREIPIPPDIDPLLLQGEQAVAAFATLRILRSSQRSDSSFVMPKD